MLEDAKEEIKRILQDNISDELDTHEDDHDVHIDLPDPKTFLYHFDRNFTVINRYPACIILGPGGMMEDRHAAAMRVVEDHRFAIVYLLRNQDGDKLNRMQSRYAESTIKILKNYNTGTYGRNDGVTQIKSPIEIAYERVLRDENESVYLGSVWLLFEVRQHETL